MILSALSVNKVEAPGLYPATAIGSGGGVVEALSDGVLNKVLDMMSFPFPS